MNIYGYLCEEKKLVFDGMLTEFDFILPEFNSERVEFNVMGIT